MRQKFKEISKKPEGKRIMMRNNAQTKKIFYLYKKEEENNPR